jgi:hypothetical protein
MLIIGNNVNEYEFQTIAKKHLRSLILWFIAFVGLTLLSFEMTRWSDSLHGWQSEVVYSIFLLVSAAGFFGFITFGAFIYSWFKEYKVALSEVKYSDIERMQHVRKNIVGPISWK